VAEECRLIEPIAEALNLDSGQATARAQTGSGANA
jgi:hypothetical protein